MKKAIIFLLCLTMMSVSVAADPTVWLKTVGGDPATTFTINDNVYVCFSGMPLGIVANDLQGTSGSCHGEVQLMTGASNLAGPGGCFEYVQLDDNYCGIYEFTMGEVVTSFNVVESIEGEVPEFGAVGVMIAALGAGYIFTKRRK